jgi:hypothetical protein
MTQSQDVGLERTRLAKIALAAWCNLDPDQLPPTKEWIEHPSDVNRQAWDRVVEAVSAEVRQAAEARAEALEVALRGQATRWELEACHAAAGDSDSLVLLACAGDLRALLPHVCEKQEEIGSARSQPIAASNSRLPAQHSNGGREP